MLSKKSTTQLKRIAETIVRQEVTILLGAGFSAAVDGEYPLLADPYWQEPLRLWLQSFPGENAKDKDVIQLLDKIRIRYMKGGTVKLREFYCELLKRVFKERAPEGLWRFDEALKRQLSRLPSRSNAARRPSLLLIPRLAKEGFLSTVLTLNFDPLLEVGCHAVGMVQHADDRSGASFQWREAYHSINHKKDYYKAVDAYWNFRIVHLHGSVDGLDCSFADRHKDTQSDPYLVFSYGELLNWRGDDWAHHCFEDAMRRSSIMLVGTRLADPVLQSSITTAFNELIGSGSMDNNPTRVFILRIRKPRQPRRPGYSVPDYEHAHLARLAATSVDEDPVVEFESIDELFQGLYAHTIAASLRDPLRKRFLYAPPAGFVNLKLKHFELRRFERFLNSLSEGIEKAAEDEHWAAALFVKFPQWIKVSFMLARNLSAMSTEDMERLVASQYYVPMLFNADLALPLLVWFGMLSHRRLRPAADQSPEDPWLRLTGSHGGHPLYFEVLPIVIGANKLAQGQVPLSLSALAWRFLENMVRSVRGIPRVVVIIGVEGGSEEAGNMAARLEHLLNDIQSRARRAVGEPPSELLRVHFLPWRSIEAVAIGHLPYSRFPAI